MFKLLNKKEKFKNKIISNNKFIFQNKFNRNNIYNQTLKKYGPKITHNIFPQSFNIPKDINLFLKNKNTQFILKKTNGYARNGLKLINNKNHIYKNLQYNQAQVYIKNPFLIKGFKFDIRMFLIIICKSNNYNIYLYKNGYNVFTKNKFNYNSLNIENKINQSFTPNNHYTNNQLPKTTQELSSYNIDFDKVLILLKNKIKYVINSIKPICHHLDKNKIKIIGMDIELLDNHEPIIIEMNYRAPVLHFDDKWKNDIIKDMENNIKNLLNNHNHNLIKL